MLHAVVGKKDEIEAWNRSTKVKRCRRDSALGTKEMEGIAYNNGNKEAFNRSKKVEIQCITSS